MATCDECGEHESMPYDCQRCGGTFCAAHRLPESHDCPGLNGWSGGAGDGHFDSGFDASLEGTYGRSGSTGPASRIVDRLPIDTGPGGVSAYFRNNTTFVFLILMWVTFGLQLIVQAVAPGLHGTLFVLQGWRLEQVWTVVTSIFAHGGIMHVAFNSIVLYFFGPLVERRVGSKAFAALFLGSGAAAGLSQELVALLMGSFSPGVVGASGAILAVMGVLTVLNPNLRVLLFFLIPMPLWVLTFGFALLSVFVMLEGGPGAGRIAHLAHLVGLVIGLAYGEKLKREGVTAPNQLRFGGGPGGPGGPGRGRF